MSSNTYTIYNTTIFIDGSSPSTQLVQGLGGGYKPLYNGNIAAMGVSLTKLNQLMVYNYGYDVLNRLVTMDAFTSSAGGWGNLQAAVNNAYQERVAYDPNGNIKSYQRNGSSSQPAMDDLHYNYYALTNQLSQITDPTPATNYPNDLDGQSAANYYQYDPIGNLIQEGDNATGNTISWNVYGKIQQVDKHGTGANTITYSYDASGNRISKTTNTATTYYVRDGSGNVLAVYEGTSSQMKVIETNLYGSTRLGLVSTQTIATTEQTITGFGTVRTFTFTRGEKSYELSNHLGNVLSTVSDRRQQMSTNNSTVSYYMAEVTSATDYYPFGMQMPNRTISSSSYRYGFNGQEKSSELTEGQFTAEFWEYDSRSGRRWNVDPVKKHYESPYITFGNNPLNLIDPDGSDTIRIQGGKNNSQIDIIYGKGTAVHTFSFKDYGFLPNVDIGKHTVDLTGIEDPDVVGLDVNGGLNLKWLGGQVGINLLWHTRGDNDTWKPEVHLYKSVSVSVGGEGDAGAAVSASVVLGYAGKFNTTTGKEEKASNEFVANGYNWTGNFWTIAGTVSLKTIDITASRFWGYDPSKGKPKDNSSYWSGFTIGVGKSASIGSSTNVETGKNIIKALSNLSGSAQVQHYYLLYGNGKDYDPKTNASLNGLNLPPVSQPTSTE